MLPGMFPQLFALQTLQEEQQRLVARQLMVAEQQHQLDKLKEHQSVPRPQPVMPTTVPKPQIVQLPKVQTPLNANATSPALHMSRTASPLQVNGASPKMLGAFAQNPQYVLYQQYLHQQQQMAALQRLAQTDPLLYQQMQAAAAAQAQQLTKTTVAPIMACAPQIDAADRKRKLTPPHSLRMSSPKITAVTSVTGKPTPAMRSPVSAAPQSQQQQTAMPIFSYPPNMQWTSEQLRTVQQFVTMLQQNGAEHVQMQIPRQELLKPTEPKKAHTPSPMSSSPSLPVSVSLHSNTSIGLRLPTVLSPKPGLSRQSSPSTEAQSSSGRQSVCSVKLEPGSGYDGPMADVKPEVKPLVSPTTEASVIVESSGTISFAVPQLSSPTESNAPSRPASVCGSVRNTRDAPSIVNSDVDEDDEPVDVVGSGNGTNTIRPQRRAHIEFYRKLKAFRNREKKLECQMCQETLDNTECNLRSHVHQHSDAPLFVCKICQATTLEQHRMFEHISNVHPGKDRHSFEDRRDMNNLSELLSNCFPRTNAKGKAPHVELIEKVIKHASDQKEKEMECQLCHKKMNAQKNALVRHLNTHPSYRCKKCKFTSEDEAAQAKHAADAHEHADAEDKSYSVCLAVDALASAVRKCFPQSFESGNASSD